MKHVLPLFAALTLSGTAYAATPNASDQTKVQDALQAQGYTKWKRIELDKGVWEVDDAIDSSGKQYDLRIDAANMKVIEKEQED